MNRWVKRSLIGLAIIVAIGSVGYWWLVLYSGTPGSGYTLDMAEIRRLADSMPGPKATQVRVERIETGMVPATMVVAGDGWTQVPLTMFSFELVFPGAPLIIDTGLPKSGAADMFFDDSAFARMSTALNRAQLIVVTHEHGDHIGGFLVQPNARALLVKTRFNATQIANAARYSSYVPKGLFAGYKPINYDRYLAIAPGVVLIRAPGHTPGSQMVYVKTGDSTEYFFTGDVAWHMRNIDLIRERPLGMTLIMGEDRGQVLSELAALHTLKRAEPKLHIITGHDPAPIDALEQTGLLKAGFD